MAANYQEMLSFLVDKINQLKAEATALINQQCDLSNPDQIHAAVQRLCRLVEANSALHSSNEQLTHILSKCSVDSSLENSQLLPNSTFADINELHQESKQTAVLLERQISTLKQKICVQNVGNQAPSTANAKVEANRGVKRGDSEDDELLNEVNNHFNGEHRIEIEHLFERLYNLKPARNSGRELNTLCDELEPILSRLHELDADNYHPLVEIALRSKIPTKATTWIYMENSEKQTRSWSIPVFCELLRLYTDIKIVDEAENPYVAQYACVYCGNIEHKSFRCTEYRPNQHEERLRELGRCLHCLSFSHTECNRTCKRCGGDHHQVLCRMPPNRLPRN